MTQRFDWLLVTAAHRAQARGYRAELRARETIDDRRPYARWMVVPDAGGRRMGSGGSTLLALSRLAARLCRDDPASAFDGLFAGRRIVIVHGGGDSRRLPAYAAHGKLFTPLPRIDGIDSPAATFDALLSTLLRIRLPVAGGVIIASGDVLLGPACDAVDATGAGILGVACPAPMEQARRHGVYTADDHGRVQVYLQKPDETTARRHGAIGADGRLLVDTGIVVLDCSSAVRWLATGGVELRDGRVSWEGGHLGGIIGGTRPPLDLYGEMLATGPARKTWIGDLPFRVRSMTGAHFLHLGTTRQLLDALSNRDTRRTFEFENGAASILPRGMPTDDLFVHNCEITGDLPSALGPAVLEAASVRSAVRLDGDNLLVGVPSSLTRPVRLPVGWGLVFVPVAGGEWCGVLFGVDDDGKTPRSAGGTIGNRPIDDMLDDHALTADRVWSTPRTDEQTLWNARLWCTGTADQVLAGVEWMLTGARPPEAWFGAGRLSLADLTGRADHRRMIAHRQRLQRRARLAALAPRLRRDDRLGARRILRDIEDRDDATTAMTAVTAIVESSPDPLLRARAYRVGELTARAWPGDGRDPALLREHALDGVRDAVGREFTIADQPASGCLDREAVARVTSPVRVDFAGGWTDTPPIGQERGGCVVNAAVRINGAHPIEARARVLDDLVIDVRSGGRDRSIRLDRSEQVLGFDDPTDWAALAKAALVIAGCAPRQSGDSLRAWLDALGGGIELTFTSSLPQGSGLGTSSALGAATLACLARLTGRPASIEALIRRTSMLEQMMRTGGGWQDQVGALVPGIKLLRTQPGVEQIPVITPIPLALDVEADLHDRMLLYYTGQRRMARDILHNVVFRYLDRDPQTLDVLADLARGAETMHADLARGDLDAFARGATRYWELKKRIDPGATTAAIEQLVRPLTPLLAGHVVTGAGGGGFVCFIARDRRAAGAIRDLLATGSASSEAGFRAVAIDHGGVG